ncbi:hypothetical protein ACG2LH_08400 [Zhouia sp. PK063]|uniref:hypothetical protein n=1 Tax=Zhouia sp. PK063 TaxID=3373602 RepID=UPI0037B76D3D
MSIELTEIEKIKNHLLLKFEGICGIGSEGNSDADFIVEKTKNEIQKDHSIQSIIFDFKDLRYSFGNRFANIFSSASLKNNKTVFIRMILNQNDLKNWRFLIDDCTNLSYNEVVSENVSDAIKSINSQMNKK